jgi:hypothetical protein
MSLLWLYRWVAIHYLCQSAPLCLLGYVHLGGSKVIDTPIFFVCCLPVYQAEWFGCYQYSFQFPGLLLHSSSEPKFPQLEFAPDRLSHRLTQCSVAHLDLRCPQEAHILGQATNCRRWRGVSSLALSTTYDYSFLSVSTWTQLHMPTQTCQSSWEWKLFSLLWLQPKSHCMYVFQWACFIGTP